MREPTDQQKRLTELTEFARDLAASNVELAGWQRHDDLIQLEQDWVCYGGDRAKS